MSDVALILEGGGMRATFSAGALDCLMAHGVRLRTVYGVSAGACLACSYLCGQAGRALRVWTNYVDDWRYCSLRSLLLTGDMFGAKLNYDLVPNRLDPLDEAAFLRDPARFFAVVTNLETGEAEYLPVTGMRRDVRLIQASASLPLISNIQRIGGKKYLDGGVADSIPIARAIRDGCARNVVLLTQAPGYRKEANRAMPLIRLRYHRYPRFVATAERRHEMYNRELALVEAEERAGRAFVIRPATAPDVGRIERDTAKLKALHAAGYAAAERALPGLLEFLEKA